MANHIVDEGRMDAAANAETSAALAAGDTFHGFLDGSGDSDWIRVELGAGASYMITVTPRDPAGPAGAAADTVLEIFNADGESVAMKDDLTVAEATRFDLSDRKHPALIFEPEAAGVYYLSVSSYAEVAATDNSGGYSLELEELDPPADPNRDMELNGDANDVPTADKLLGAGGKDTIKGGELNDFLSGGGDNDELFGEEGDDTLEGGPGADTLDGGTNTYGAGKGDTVTYANSAEAVEVNLGRAEASGGDAEGDEIMNVENIIGSAGDDWLRGDTNDNILTGLAGDDTLIGGGGGDDTLNGGAGDDTLNGGEGNDMLTGGAGADMITGGPGGDTISYAGSDAGVDIRLSTGHASGGHAEGDEFSAVEHVTGSSHNDRLAGDDEDEDGTGGNNILSGDGGDDEIYGGSGDDTLNGGAGDDTLYGGAGDDMVNGGAGDDLLIGGAGGDGFTGGAGTDTVSYANARDEKVTVDLGSPTGSVADASNPSHSDGDYFPADHSVENVIGSPRGDTIDGDDNNNKIWGGAGADALNGEGGDDTIDGGPGGDDIDGGALGEDTVTYAESDAGVRVTISSTATESPTSEGGYAEGDRLSNVENLIGSDHNDRLFGDAGANTLKGGDGDDQIRAGTGDDTVEGGAGADTMGGDAGADGAGDGFALGTVQSDSDTLSYASSTGSVTIDLSRQYAAAGATNEQVRVHYATGSGGDAVGDRFRGFENVTGGMGNDRLTGDGFNNILLGGPGADQLDGGNAVTAAGDDGNFGTDDDVETSGVDTASYAGSPAGVTITFSERRVNNDDVTTGVGSGGHAAGDRLLNIEKVVGTAHDDTFIASNLTQIFDGGENAMDNLMTPDVDESVDSDTVSYASLNTEVVANPDRAMGDAATAIVAGSGNYENIENLIGGSANDHLAGDANSNRLVGNAGVDTLAGEAGADTLIGGAGNDVIGGGDGFDLLNGGRGADWLDGDAGTGANPQGTNVQSFWNLDGGRANVDNDADATATSYGGDTVTYAGSLRGVELILGALDVDGPDDTGGNADDFRSASASGKKGHADGDTVLNVENIIGSDHDDVLAGNNWFNVLTGGKGDDTLTGDAVAGNAQSDIFVFAPGDSTGEDGDVITDFNVSGITLDGDSDGTPDADIYGNDIYYLRDAIDLRAFNFDLDRDANGVITTTLANLEEQDLKISDLIDADGDGTKDDREITLPDGGKITLIGGASAIGELTIDNFIFDLA